MTLSDTMFSSLPEVDLIHLFSLPSNFVTTFRSAAFLGLVFMSLLFVVIWNLCCAQPKRNRATTESLESFEKIPLTRGHSESREPPLSYPESPNISRIPPSSGKMSPHNSFENLVDLARPAIKHLGASLPVGTLQAAVKSLNDRMRYRFVTSKTHVGGGLSSIFTEDNEFMD